MPAQNDHSSAHPRLVMTFSQLPNFCQILQGGFQVDIESGCSLRELLCRQWNFDPGYVESRISTIFLDGKPVDDLDAAVLHDGATLALSAAMPGLVGATMRRGGFYAQFRGGISHHQESGSHSPKRGRITLKLFNILADEVGISFLQHGIRLKRKDLELFLTTRSDSFWAHCEAATLDGRTISGQELRQKGRLPDVEWIELSVVVPT